MILFPTPNLQSSQYLGAYVIAPFDVAGCGAPKVTPVTSVTQPVYGAFKRVWVSYLYKGIAYIYWEFNRAFADPGPYSFQLQGSHAGIPRADDWFNIGGVSGAFFATDDGGPKHQRMFGKTPTLHYRVLATTSLGCYVSMIANVLGLLNKHDWLIVQEILRKEQLAHRIFSSVKGYLFKARRYGPECIDCRDQQVSFQGSHFTDEIINTNCGTCYGTGFINGYYPATEYYALLTPEETYEHRGEQGTMKDIKIQGRFIATLPLIHGDVWVNIGSDERYYIHGVKESALWKSVPIVYEAELRLAPFTDAIYSIPLK